ncbi:MAG: hypothetical protein ACON4P_00095 [Candidatus Puniceispirillales bacterium]
MASSKDRPENVPEENVYDKVHWTLYLAIIGVIAALYLLVQAG